jgi:DNA-binding FadR family transcriptional regulator
LKTEKDLTDICETRLLLETELAALAAKRATATDRKRLRALGDKMQASVAGDGNPYMQLDVEFHIAIADASHNRLLRRLLADIREVLADFIAKSQAFPGGLQSAHRHHTRILNSILEGNAEAARRAMRQHIETFQKAYKLLGLAAPPQKRTDKRPTRT